MKNKLIWIDTLNKHMDEIYEITDTGFCNRIRTWDILYFLNSKNNFKFDIEMGESWWPELKEVLEFPNTVLRSENIDLDRKEKIQNIISDSQIIDEDFLLNSNDFKLEDKNYYVDVSYSFASKFLVQHNATNSGISFITFKDKNIKQTINREIEDLVGIHVRRGRGVKYKEKLDKIPKDIVEEYIKFHNQFGESTYEYYMYDYVEDDVYFKIIDETLKQNPNQKFYLSHDLSDDLMEYYEKKYGDKIITRKNFYHLIDNFENTNLNHIVDCIDLICLSSTKLVITSNHSTWSRFASDYKSKKNIQANSDFEMEEYLNLYKEIC